MHFCGGGAANRAPDAEAEHYYRMLAAAP